MDSDRQSSLTSYLTNQLQKITGEIERRRFLKTMLALGAAGTVAGLPIALLRHSKATSIPKLYHERAKILGTWVSITIFSSYEKLAKRALHQALDQVRQVDELMSVHRESSQLNAINRAAGVEAVTVDPRILEVLTWAQKYFKASNGVYDVTILPVMRLFGFYGEKRATFPKDREIVQALEAVGAQHVEMNLAENKIGLTRKGAGLDFGSLGKGYALDRAAMALKHNGITSALLDAGGKLIAIGAPYEDPDPRAGWRVGIRDPRVDRWKGSGNNEKWLETFLLRDQSIATSGVDQNFVKFDSPNSKEIGHLFNALTGRPLDTYLTCTAVAPIGVEADALSTVGYVMGKQKADEMIQNNPSNRFYFFT